MNQEECARVVSLVRTLYPHQRMDENPQNVVDAWSLVIADLEFDEARAAIIAHGRSAAPWCSPGDIRRRVARMRNVLAPNADALLRDLQYVAAHGGEGRRMLHPLAARVYASAGGAPGITNLTPAQTQQLLRQVERDVDAFNEDALTSPKMYPAVRPYEPVAELNMRHGAAQIGE